MKQIIKNKVYDTSTAREMGTYKNLEASGTSEYYEETLYRKKTGEYFIYAYGGPESKYRKITGYSNWTSQGLIMPLTYDEAQKWAKIALTEEQYEGIFGITDEGTETEALTVRLPKALVIQLKRRTDKTGQMIKEAVAEALRQWLKR